ncbi:MAG: hypothetical protein NTZ90_18460 [Proteobacteria bacterium]|nr:hypothetical protein [Pseudomonadota bacterium]
MLLSHAQDVRASKWRNLHAMARRDYKLGGAVGQHVVSPVNGLGLIHRLPPPAIFFIQ